MPTTERTRSGGIRAGRRPGRGWSAVVILGVVVVLVVAVVLLRRDDGSGFDRSGSALLEDAAPGLFPVERPPPSYRIDYRVEGLGGDSPVVTSDRLWVRRPFESRLEVFDGPEPTGDPSTVQIGSLGAFRAVGEDAGLVVVAAPPGPPGSDTRIAAALDEALADGRVELRERREVLGRPCQVIRSATLLASGDLAPPGDGDHADTCIDDRGLVLEELLIEDGEPLLRRVAVDVEIEPDLDDVSFATGDPTVPVDRGGGFVQQAEPGSRPPGTFFEPRVPDGFEYAGRFVVIPPQHDNFTDISRRAHRLTYVSDVFVDGPSVIVLDQGGTLGNVDPFPDLRGVEVQIDALGTAVLSYGRTGPVLVLPRGQGRFLRARGTGSTDVLVRMLEGLEQVEGGELRLLDGDR